MVVKSCALPQVSSLAARGAWGALTCPASLPIFFSFTPLRSWPPQAAAPHIETPGPLCRGSGWGICSLLSPKSWFCFQSEKPILSPAHQQWGGAKAFPAQAHAAIPLVTGGPSPGERDAKHRLMCTEASPKSYSQEQSPRQFTPAQGTSLVGTICFLVSAIKTGQPPTPSGASTASLQRGDRPATCLALSCLCWGNAPSWGWRVVLWRPDGRRQVGTQEAEQWFSMGGVSVLPRALR